MENIHTKFSSLILIILFHNFLFGQAPDIEWEKTIGSSGNQMIFGSYITIDGGIVSGGYTSFGLTDFYLLKTDSNGETLWEKTFGLDDRSENAWDINSTSDGGTIMVGACDGNFPYTYNSDVYIIKTNADGDFQWDSQIGGDTVGESCVSIMQTTDGGYIMCGSIWAFPETGWDVHLIKTHGDGTIIWQEFYDFDFSADKAASVIQTTDGGYAIAGETQAFSTNYGHNAFILKTDASGNTLWLKTYGYVWPQEEEASCIIQTSDNGYLICGNSSKDGLVNKDWYVVKTNENGDSLWQRTYGGTYQEGAQYVCEPEEGGYVITGTMYIEGMWDAFIMKYNELGDTLWTKQWGDPDYSQNEYFIGQTPDNGFIVSGNTNTESNNFDAHITKFYPETVGIIKNQILNQKQIVILNNISPNPCKTELNISYSTAVNGIISHKIFNIQGKLKMRLPGIYQKSGVHKKSFKTCNLPNGIYFYHLSLNGYSQVERICVLH